MRFSPTKVHAQEHLGPVLGFRTAGTGLNVEVGVVGIHLAREHAPKFKASNLLFELVEVRLDFGGRVVVAFLEGHFEQFPGVAKSRLQLVEADHNLFELRPLLTKRLCALRIVPHVRFFEFALDLGQAVCLAFVVKDTPSTHLRVQ